MVQRNKTPFTGEVSHDEDQRISMLSAGKTICTSTETISINAFSEKDARARHSRETAICRCGYPLVKLTRIRQKK